MSRSPARLLEDLWYGDDAAARVAGTVLAPLAGAFGAAARLRAVLYRRGVLARRRAPRPVVSVGSLRVGGAGKTPFVLWLAARLVEDGLRPCIVTRGYGGDGATSPQLLDAATAGDPAATGRAGDEAVLLALRSALPVAVGADRLAACRLAMERLGATAHEPDLFILDDGFQHLALARDLDIVLVAGTESRERLLPAGPLREPPSALGRADAVVLAGDAVGEAGPLAARALVLRARTRPAALVRSVRDEAGDDAGTLAGLRVAAVSAIARPERFRRQLEGLGADVVATLVERDHHRYTQRDVERIEKAGAGADLVVTTEKDLVKLAALRFGVPVAALRIAAEVEPADALVELVRSRVHAHERFDR